MDRSMTSKLDFSGFDRPPVPTPDPPRTRRATPKAKSRTTKKPTRRKQRVNVSLKPAVSRQAMEQARSREMTLSDLLRSAYRSHLDSLGGSDLDQSPRPFEHRSSTSHGRMIHMLYLAEDEVAILDELAAKLGTSRSGIVGVLFERPER